MDPFVPDEVKNTSQNQLHIVFLVYRESGGERERDKETIMMQNGEMQTKPCEDIHTRGQLPRLTTNAPLCDVIGRSVKNNKLFVPGVAQKRVLFL